MTSAENAPTLTRESRSRPVGTQTPPVNIHQDKDGFTLVVEMPGVSKSGVEVTFEEGKLVISGNLDAAPAREGAVYREISDATYRRVFDLDPSIDAAGIVAAIEQGVLSVRLPKAEGAKPRKITVS